MECHTEQSQPEVTEEPETNSSVPWQEKQKNTIDGIGIVEITVMYTTSKTGQTMSLSQFLRRKRESPMQSMQKWIYLNSGHRQEVNELQGCRKELEGISGMRT